MNRFQAIKELYKGKNISHEDWGDTNQVYYVKRKFFIPCMFVWGDEFRAKLKGKNNLFVTCNPFKIFNYKSDYIEWYQYN